VRLALEDVRKSLGGRSVLSGASLSLEEGQFCVVIGPTGCGKTTLLKIADLLMRPDAGRVECDGVDLAHAGEGRRVRARRRMAMVMQRPWVGSGTVRDNAGFALKARGLPRDAAVDETLASVGLRDLADQEARTLSGGEIQKLALARALISSPEVLILDEPLSSLDAGTRPGLRDLLRSLHRERGMTVLMATHDSADALALATSAAVMLGGRIRHSGSIEEVFSRSAGGFVSAFLGVRNVIPVSFDGTRARAGSLEIHIVRECEGTGFISVTPEAVTLSLARLESSQRNCLKGVVASVERQAIGWLVEVDCGPFRLSSSVTQESVEELALEPGAAVFASFKASAVTAFR